MRRDPAAAHPVLWARYEQLVGLWDVRSPNEHLQITCIWRSPEEQHALWLQGRETSGKKVTNCDGYSTISEHQRMPSRAIDVCVLVDGVSMSPTLHKVHVASWDEDKYLPLGELCRAVGLVWGGSWPRKKRDMPHIQLPDDVRS